MEFRTLETTPLEVIHAAFLDAFSEYQVPLDMPLAKLEFMMVTRSYRADLSWGAFEGDVLAGFVLVGYRDPGRPTAYDIATGVTRGFQAQGLGSQLLERVFGHLGDRGVERFVLEVLEDNAAAQGLYARWGLKTTRRLNCYSLASPALVVPEGYTLALEASPPTQAEAWNGFVPSWQNARASWEARPDDHAVWVLRRGGRAVGCLVGQMASRSVASRSILLWGVEDQARGLEDVLLAAFLAGSDQPGRYLNVEEGSPPDLRLSQKAPPFVRQWEQEVVLVPRSEKVAPGPGRE